MEIFIRKIAVVLAGLLLGFITYRFFYGWYDVFPWAVVALIIGYATKSRRASIINGAIFGYFLFLVYIYLGYRGKTDTNSMMRFILFDLFFSLAGAIAGVVGSFIGNWVKTFFKRDKNDE